MRVVDGTMLVVRDSPAAMDAVGVPVNSLRMMMLLPKLSVRDVLGWMQVRVVVNRHGVVLRMEDPQVIDRTVVIEPGLGKQSLEIGRYVGHLELLLAVLALRVAQVLHQGVRSGTRVDGLIRHWPIIAPRRSLG
jgi:hypothetical protein